MSLPSFEIQERIKGRNLTVLILSKRAIEDRQQNSVVLRKRNKYSAYVLQQCHFQLSLFTFFLRTPLPPPIIQFPWVV
ncbi:hypothetical protein VNO77_11635 [Canavalia gladiata]|uniref:Uncharacterized protein n=1 Tax=Canavalia gladiata TaxID=3824 RepID=A0AAN9MC68_CANGL